MECAQGLTLYARGMISLMASVSAALMTMISKMDSALKKWQELQPLRKHSQLLLLRHLHNKLILIYNQSYSQLLRYKEILSLDNRVRRKLQVLIMDLLLFLYLRSQLYNSLYQSSKLPLLLSNILLLSSRSNLLQFSKFDSLWFLNNPRNLSHSLLLLLLSPNSNPLNFSPSLLNSSHLPKPNPLNINPSLTLALTHPPP